MAQASAARAPASVRDSNAPPRITVALSREPARIEPLLRRAVPVLVLLFIASLGFAVFPRLAADREGRIAVAMSEARLLAGALAAVPDLADIPERAGRGVVIVDGAGKIRRSTVLGMDAGEMLARLAPEAAAALGGNSFAGPIALSDGRSAVLATRRLAPPREGAALVLHDVAAGTSAWRGEAMMSLTLFLATAFVVLLLGLAFHWQSVRAEEADAVYARARGRMEAALARGRCGLWEWDFERDLVYWSPSMFDILGRAPRDGLLRFSEIAELIHRDDFDHGGLASLVAAGGGTFDREFRVRHASGTWVWLRARGEIVRGARGHHLIGVAVDVTEQKDLAERTQAADLRLREAIETVPAAFVLWDGDNRLVTCNSRFQELHGLPDAYVRPGTRYEDVLAKGRQPVVTRRVRNEAFPVEGVCTFEVQLEDGRWLTISERRTKDGGYVSVGADITALKRHEAQLMESDAQLRRMVETLSRSQTALELKARELAVMASKYAEEKSRAEAASRSKSEFLANISHELRTPLNAIIGFSEIMQSGLFGPIGQPKYIEYCADIRKSGQYLLDVINDILDMSRVEAGRFDLKWEIFDAGAVLDEVARILSGRAEEKRVHVTLDVPAGLETRADRRALKQIALNLLSNAIKFTGIDGRVVVKMRAQDGDAVLRIEDNGIGIPADMIDKLGQPFAQVENQYTKNHKGSGLGLAITRSLAELHGGSLAIRSVEGLGTSVTVRLPGAVISPASAPLLPGLDQAAA